MVKKDLISVASKREHPLIVHALNRLVFGACQILIKKLVVVVYTVHTMVIQPTRTDVVIPDI